ncbi:MAG: Gfo/Idh/MocA family oxidoreductase [Acidimicrobiales bacterium]
MRTAVIGAGALGARAARQLLSTPGVEEVLVYDLDPRRTEWVVASLGSGASALHDLDPLPHAAAAVLATPAQDQPELARRLLLHGMHVVGTADSIEAVNGLLALDDLALERRRGLVVGAGLSPGLGCLLARHAANRFDSVDEIHVARTGTGGPACARQHHAALGGDSLDWRDGAWGRRPGGSGRQLVWFPDPLGARDCYRAALPEAALLQRSFASAARITARMSATRRDRLTSRLPMLRRPHAEGGPGAVRVEVWGRYGETRDVVVYGAMDSPGVAAGAVAALSATWLANGRLDRFGAYGLAALAEPVPLLLELEARGVRAAAFVGAA